MVFVLCSMWRPFSLLFRPEITIHNALKWRSQFLNTQRQIGTLNHAFTLDEEKKVYTMLQQRKICHSNKFPTRPTTQKDLKFFESLIEFTTQCTFIEMHRRAFNAICEFLFQFCTSFLGFNFLAFAQRKFFAIFHNFSSFPVTFFVVTACELNRLFRTEFFNLVRTKCCRYQFSFREQQVSQRNNVVRINVLTFFFRFFMVTSGSRIHWRISVIKIRLWWLTCCWLHQSQKKKFSELDKRNISGICH